MARSARSSAVRSRGAGSRAWPPTTSCSRMRAGARRCAIARRATCRAGGDRGRRRGRRRSRHFGGHRERHARCGGERRAGDAAGGLPARRQFRVAAHQGGLRRRDRGGRWPVRRGRGHDLGAAVRNPRADAGRRARTRRRSLRRSPHWALPPRWPRDARRRLGDQDVPQRHDQGHGGDRHRELPRRAAVRRRGRGARIAGRDLSRTSTGRRTAAISSPRRPARPAPRGGDARSGGDGPRGRARAVHGERDRRPPCVGGRPRARRHVRRRRSGSGVAGRWPTGSTAGRAADDRATSPMGQNEDSSQQSARIT